MVMVSSLVQQENEYTTTTTIRHPKRSKSPSSSDTQLNNYIKPHTIQQSRAQLNCQCILQGDPHITIYGLVHPSIHCCMGSAPIGVQYPLTSSLGEFPGYWYWLWCPELSPLLVSFAFSLHLSMYRCFSSRSSSPAIEFHSCFFFMTDVSAPIGRPFTYSLFR